MARPARNWPTAASWPLLAVWFHHPCPQPCFPVCLFVWPLGSRKIVGPIDQQASICLLSFERSMLRHRYRLSAIERWTRFVAQAKVPVLLVFYQPLDETNTRVIRPLTAGG
jgi:hypothetical protein